MLPPSPPSLSLFFFFRFFKSGYGSMVCHRPHLVDLLLSKIPKGKLHYGKRVVSVT